MAMFNPSEWSLDDSQEPYALPDGTEARLRILSVEKPVEREDGSSYMTARMEVVDHPYSKEVSAFLEIPNARVLDAKRLNNARHRMKEFMACFGLDGTRMFDPTEDWPLREGWVILSMRTSPEYGDQNRIAKYLPTSR